MKTASQITTGTKVAKSANKSNTEYYTGLVTDLKNNKALVKFESRGFSRWCSISNLEVVTK